MSSDSGNLLSTSLINKNEKKNISKFQIANIIISSIGFILVIFVSFKAISKAPIEEMDKQTGFTIINKLVATQWLIDKGDFQENIDFKNDEFEKIEFANKFLNEQGKLPVFFYKKNNNSGLARELGFLFYDENQKYLVIEFPSNKIYKFLYTKASNSEIENLSIINKKNNRIFYIKESMVKKGNK